MKRLTILEFEDKRTQKDKPYTRFKTDDGWMSCFDQKECDKLKKLKGHTVSLDLKEQGEFKNIVKCYGDAQDGMREDTSLESSDTDVVPKPAMQTISRSRTMYVSYAKDIFLRLMDENEMSFIERMDMAIALVKQAEEAF